MITFVIPQRTPKPVSDYLAAKGASLPSRVVSEFYEDWHGRSSFAPGTYVLTGLEWLDDDMRAFLSRVRRELAGRADIRFLNDGGTLRRYDLLTMLERTGRNPFRVRKLGATWSGLTYPLFLRSERHHTGALSPLLHTRRDVERAVCLALLGGYEVDDLLVVEHLDTASASGLYVKYTAFIVGNRIIPKALQSGPGWMLKHQLSDYTEEALQAESEYVEQNPHRDEVAAIASLAGIEYGRIDYTIFRGRITTWEFNLNPSIGGFRPIRSEAHNVTRAKRAARNALFFDRLADALRSIDLPSEGPEIPIAFAAPKLQAPRRVYELDDRLQEWADRFSVAGPLLGLVGRAAVFTARAEANLSR